MKTPTNGLVMSKQDNLNQIMASFEEIEGIYCKKCTWKLDNIWTVLIIERVLIKVSIAIMRLYSTYNRNVCKKMQTVLIIEQYL